LGHHHHHRRELTPALKTPASTHASKELRQWYDNSDKNGDSCWFFTSRAVAAQVDPFESKGLKPVVHSIGFKG
jgi:hypothetical protein